MKLNKLKTESIGLVPVHEIKKQRFSSNRKIRTIREFIPSPDFLQWVFPDSPQKFYYCHVTMDQMTVEMTPPDVFTMAYETGLNLVGLSVALDVFADMILKGGSWAWYLPHYYFIFNSPKKYINNQKLTFEAMSALIPLAAEDLYMNGYYIARAGGGLANYLYLLSDWHSQVSVAEVNCLQVFTDLFKSKEFAFVEYDLHDPTYGNLMFNNLTYSKDNTRFSDDATEWMGINWNIFNPQRFEEFLKPYITKIYDVTTSISDIYKENKVTSLTTAYDTLGLTWVIGNDELGRPIPTVTDVNFSQNISENREKTNMIVRFKNKPLGESNADTTEHYWFLKSGFAVEQFFRAASFFLWHPVITNYLYELWQFETGQTLYRTKRLWPTKIKVDKQGEFTQSLRDGQKYGRPLESGMGNYLQKNLTEIGGSSSAPSSGTVECLN